MLYYFFTYIWDNFPGAGLFQYLSFRSAMAFITALLFSLLAGKKIINRLRKMQIGETVRDLGLEGQKSKEGTPTMGGIIIILATLIPVVLFTDLNNIYIQMLLFTLLWMGSIGFADDYIKVVKKNKEGLAGKFKVLGQLGLGIVIGWVMLQANSITIRTENHNETIQQHKALGERFMPPEHSLKTTIPMVKNNEFDYASVLKNISPSLTKFTGIFFILIVIFIITAVSNAANLTDGIDGLAAGTSAIIVIALAILAWVSGNILVSDYLNIMYIPHIGEVSVFISAFAGALIGFLWFNAFPAQVFMGDTGSLTIGAIIAVVALFIRKELLIPVLAGIFVVENASVIIQRFWFKYTKKKYGEGRRVFLMSPIHHHFQKLGWHENKIVIRFWIIGIILAAISIISLKVR
jgi:phospho-N-acetylmuramoyl-pentapeptide-transferase